MKCITHLIFAVITLDILVHVAVDLVSTFRVNEVNFCSALTR